MEKFISALLEKPMQFGLLLLSVVFAIWFFFIKKPAPPELGPDVTEGGNDTFSNDARILLQAMSEAGTDEETIKKILSPYANKKIPQVKLSEAFGSPSYDGLGLSFWIFRKLLNQKLPLKGWLMQELDDDEMSSINESIKFM
jgi:hypothetical protein